MTSHDETPGMPIYPHDHRSVPRGSHLGPLVWVLVLLLGMGVLPYVVEQVEFALTRGKERAQAEVAREVLGEMPATHSPYSLVAKAIAPSVVGIVVTGTADGRDEWSHLFEPRRRRLTASQGSGVIVDKSGYVLPNAHLVANADAVVVRLSDGRNIGGARLVGADPLSDLAVLSIDASDLVAAPWGDSEKLEVGDPVIAVGSPFGLARTVTAGIISAKRRRGLPIGSVYQDFLQTDAAVNPGNSGGPLVDMAGRVVGINTAIVGEAYQGISFAIPSDVAREVYEKLRATGKIARGWLGVNLQSVDEQLARQLGLPEAHGAWVAGVLRGSPAEKAGLEAGDVIVEFDGKPVDDANDLTFAVGRTAPGARIKVVLIRDGKRQELNIAIGERPKQLSED